MQAMIFGLGSTATEVGADVVRLTIVNRAAERSELSLELSRVELEVLAGREMPATMRRTG